MMELRAMYIGEKNIVHRNKAMSMKMLQHIFLC